MTANARGGSLRPVVTCALLAWAALAFGGVYTWGWVPLLAGCTTVGAGAVWAGARLGTLHRGLVAGLLALTVAVSLQLVPCSPWVLDVISPAATRFLIRYDLAYAWMHGGLGASHASPASVPAHPLSIDPIATLIGIAFLLSFGLLFLGLSATVSAHEARRICDGVLVVGLLLALTGLVQKSLSEGAIYGFWPPSGVGDPFGPFVNKNHFAGWMMMALPLCVGRLCERLAGALHQAGQAWRDRLVWLSSAQASLIVLSGFALFAIALSLVLTFSRSGIGSVGIALLLFTAFIARSSAKWPMRLAAGGYVAVLFAAAVGWSGVDALIDRFAVSTAGDLFERTTAWRDALSIARDFPMAGTGLNTYGTATILYQSPELTHHYSAAHSDYLQLAAEGGLLLGVPAVAIVVIFLATLRARLRHRNDAFWLRAGAATSLTAIALQELVDFSLQIPANTALFVVVAAIAIHPARRPPICPDPHRA